VVDASLAAFQVFWGLIGAGVQAVVTGAVLVVLFSALALRGATVGRPPTRRHARGEHAQFLSVPAVSLGRTVRDASPDW
jgi:hypothetical protein